MITKSDFLEFQKSPIHYWASINNLALTKPPSLFDQHLFEQGKEAERYAKRYIYEVVAPGYAEADVLWQQTYSTAELESRADAVIYDRKNNVYDIYEIKSSTGVDKENEIDVTFQSIVYEDKITVRDIFIVHVNKDYERKGEINIEELFSTINMNEHVKERRDEASRAIRNAISVAKLTNPESLEPCLKPIDCVCPDICHPDIQPGSIFDINGLRKNKKQELINMGVSTILEIPEDYVLPAGQLKQVHAAKLGKPVIEKKEIFEDVSSLEFPLYFVDYEAFNPAIPYFDGYGPYQFIPFQYSLHVVESIGDEAVHVEYLDLDEADPGARLAKHLLENIGETGSIIVWNKTFEMGRNKEMAVRYPYYQEKLLALNERIYDLMVVFRKGYYAHPDFLGKYSIKKVLPVLVPDLTYESLEISSGDESMMIWNKIHLGEYPGAKIDQTILDMLEYCKLDTLAMVRIWEHLCNIVQ